MKETQCHSSTLTGNVSSRAGEERRTRTVLVLPGDEVRQDPAEVVVVAGVDRHAVDLGSHPPDVAVAAAEVPVGRAADPLRHGVVPQPRRRQCQERRGDEQRGRRHGDRSIRW